MKLMNQISSFTIKGDSGIAVGCIERKFVSLYNQLMICYLKQQLLRVSDIECDRSCNERKLCSSTTMATGWICY